MVDSKDAPATAKQVGIFSVAQTVVNIVFTVSLLLFARSFKTVLESYRKPLTEVIESCNKHSIELEFINERRHLREDNQSVINSDLREKIEALEADISLLEKRIDSPPDKPKKVRMPRGIAEM